MRGQAQDLSDRTATLTVTVSAAAPAPPFGGVTTIFAGNLHSCALTTASQSDCWGHGSFGELGATAPDVCADTFGNSPCSKKPVAVTGGLTFTSISSSVQHTCGLIASGAAYCWGRNLYGQLGDGTTTDRFAPTPVGGGLTFSAISAGNTHTCALTSNGTAYCWGGGGQNNGQIGDGTTAPRLVPTAVIGGLTFTALSAGYFHTCGLSQGGAAYCWGNNFTGAIGDNTTTHRLEPTAVGSGLTFIAVSAGFSFTCGITSTGADRCWGTNVAGQLGDGSTTQRLAPTPVAGSLTFVALSAGHTHSCGIIQGGAAYCWGSNSFGEMGIGNATGPQQCGGKACSPSPLLVIGGHLFSMVSAGGIAPFGIHTCGVTTGGFAYCWGANADGELGDGTTTQRPVPTAVAAPY